MLIYQIKVRCPRCRKMGLRVLLDEGRPTRLICKDCRKVDEVVTEGMAWECVSAITQLAKPEMVSKAWARVLSTLITEKLIERE